MFGIGNQLDTLIKFVNNNIILILKRLYNLYKFVTKFILKTFKFLPLTIPIFIILFLYIILFIKKEGQVNAMLCLLCYIALIIILSAISIFSFIKVFDILELIIIKIIKERKKFDKAKKGNKSNDEIKAGFSLFGLAIALVGIIILILICGLIIFYMAYFNNIIYNFLNVSFNPSEG